MAKTLDEIVAYQFALELKDEVYALIDRSPRVRRDLRFYEQLTDAVSGVARTIAEGFARRNPADFANFLRFSLGSIGETHDALHDGIDRTYFSAADARASLTWVDRCKRVTESLRASQLRLAEEDRRRRAGEKQQRSSRRNPRRSPPPKHRRKPEDDAGT